MKRRQNIYEPGALLTVQVESRLMFPGQRVLHRAGVFTRR